jgi:hypothetical protein
MPQQLALSFNHDVNDGISFMVIDSPETVAVNPDWD